MSSFKIENELIFRTILTYSANNISVLIYSNNRFIFEENQNVKDFSIKYPFKLAQQ